MGPAAIIGLLAVGLTLPTIVGMFLPIVLVGSFMREDAPPSHKAVAGGFLALCAWAYLPLAYDFFWHRGGILKFGVITHGLISLIISGVFIWLLVRAIARRQSRPEPAPQRPAENTPLRRWCHKHPHLDAQAPCTDCDRWSCANCTVPFPNGPRCEPCALAMRFPDS